MMGQRKIWGRGYKIITFFLMLLLLHSISAPVLAKETEPVTAPANGTIYLDTQAGRDNNEGLSADDSVYSLEYALELVADGGVIRLVDKLTITEDIAVTDKKVVFKFSESGAIVDYGEPMIDIWSGVNATFENVVFDGEGRAEKHNGILKVSGTLTLGENTEVKNFKSTAETAAAIEIYTGAVVNLNGTKITDNSCGSLGQSYCGGITVAGTLNIGAGTIITGNVMQNNAAATDILLTSDGVVNMDGDATVGTLAFASGKPSDPTLFLKSALTNEIKMRMQKNYGTIVLPGFNLGDVLASGKDGYEISEEDVTRIILPNPTQHTVEKDANKRAYVEGVPYEIIIAPMEGGTVRADSNSVRWGKSTNLTPVADAGYKYIENTITAHEEGNPGSAFYLSKNADGSSWSLKMSITDNAVVEAAFEKIPAVTPNIEVNLPALRNIIEEGELKLQVGVEQAEGNSLSYQWYKDGQEIPGETQATLTRKNAKSSDAGAYYVQVSNETVAGATASAVSSTCAVKVAKKTVAVESSKEVNGKVADTEQLWNSALTETEKKEYQEQGVDISVYMKLEPLNASEDQPHIDKVLGNKKMGKLLDISIYKKIGDLEETYVRELSEEMTITIDIPVELRPKDGQKRAYSIVRVHKNEDGAVQTDILADLDTNTDTLTFKTKLFSTYAMIYDDEVQTSPVAPTKQKAAQTGDTQSVAFPVAAGLVSLLVISAVSARRRKK